MVCGKWTTDCGSSWTYWQWKKFHRNSILGKRAFKSKASSSGITKTTELQRTELKDGQIIIVIGTPGMVTFSAESEFIVKEIIKCIKLAKDGIHC
ncbi:hypothetical protein Patl1_07574 [Pistacia atlantica]|uniref:Uncharacterized protein n=1 Tax=Pistacia atlantica TaxID=434234 RepID=A0ACC1AFV2_9ROSI|nr:hypothetical protein Patl1_07574 [Pistacia atlantica]